MNSTRLIIAAGTIAAALGAATAARAEGPIAQRMENQQRRIAQGVASGQLTARETVRLERGQVALGREVGAMRRANDGTLTPAQRALVGRQQDRLSGAIFRLKHNAAQRR